VSGHELNRLDLSGFERAPSQTLGAIRLIPLLKRGARDDLRIGIQKSVADLHFVTLRGQTLSPKSGYISYIPHAFVFSWGEGRDRVSNHPYRTTLGGEDFVSRDGVVGVFDKLVKKRDRQLRLLPLHFAMEGFLNLFVKGPQVAYNEYATEVFTQGLSPRMEQATQGSAIHRLEEALSVFELYPDQVGVALCVGESLASLFIVSHPDDYRALHSTLLRDFFSDHLYHYGLLHPALEVKSTLNATSINSIDDLEGALAELYADQASFQDILLKELNDATLYPETVQKMGPFRLQRFHTGLQALGAHHIGEVITREDGSWEYLKTYRLSKAQAKRVYLLQSLAQHDWDLDRTAEFFNQSKLQLTLRIERAGFGYILKPHVLEAARAGRG